MSIRTLKGFRETKIKKRDIVTEERCERLDLSLSSDVGSWHSERALRKNTKR